MFECNFCLVEKQKNVFNQKKMSISIDLLGYLDAMESTPAQSAFQIKRR